MIDTTTLKKYNEQLAAWLNKLYGSLQESPDILNTFACQSGAVAYYYKQMADNDKNSAFAQTRFRTSLSGSIETVTEVFAQKKELYHFWVEDWFIKDGGKQLIENMQKEIIAIKKSYELELSSPSSSESNKAGNTPRYNT